MRAPHPRRIWLLAAALLALAACQPAPASGRPKLTIAWVTKSLGNPVFDPGKAGALQKGRELTEAGPYDVEVLVVGPVSADAIEQARMMDDLIARRVDGIAISCNDPAACVAPIDRAVEAGIPVMTWDSDSPDSRRFSFLSIDNYKMGQESARILADSIGGQGKVAIISGVPGALNLDQRVAGFKDAVAAAYPGIQVVATIASNEDINLGVQGVEETMQAHPDLRGWFFAGLWPLFADRGSMPLWERATRERGLKTVAFDTLPVEIALMREGYVEALIGQKYRSWGYQSVEMVYDYIAHGTRYPPFIDMGADIVTRDTLDTFVQAQATGTPR